MRVGTQPYATCHVLSSPMTPPRRSSDKASTAANAVIGLSSPERRKLAQLKEVEVLPSSKAFIQAEKDIKAIEGAVSLVKLPIPDVENCGVYPFSLTVESSMEIGILVLELIAYLPIMGVIDLLFTQAIYSAVDLVVAWNNDSIIDLLTTSTQFLGWLSLFSVHCIYTLSMLFSSWVILSIASYLLSFGLGSLLESVRPEVGEPDDVPGITKERLEDLGKAFKEHLEGQEWQLVEEVFETISRKDCGQDCLSFNKRMLGYLENLYELVCDHRVETLLKQDVFKMIAEGFGQCRPTWELVVVKAIERLKGAIGSYRSQIHYYVERYKEEEVRLKIEGDMDYPEYAVTNSFLKRYQALFGVRQPILHHQDHALMGVFLSPLRHLIALLQLYIQFQSVEALVDGVAAQMELYGDLGTSDESLEILKALVRPGAKAATRNTQIDEESVVIEYIAHTFFSEENDGSYHINNQGIALLLRQADYLV